MLEKTRYTVTFKEVKDKKHIIVKKKKKIKRNKGQKKIILKLSISNTLPHL